MPPKWCKSGCSLRQTEKEGERMQNQIVPHAPGGGRRAGLAWCGLLLVVLAVLPAIAQQTAGFEVFGPPHVRPGVGVQAVADVAHCGAGTRLVWTVAGGRLVAGGEGVAVEVVADEPGVLSARAFAIAGGCAGQAGVYEGTVAAVTPTGAREVGQDELWAWLGNLTIREAAWIVWRNGREIARRHKGA